MRSRRPVPPPLWFALGLLGLGMVLVTLHRPWAVTTLGYPITLTAASPTRTPTITPTPIPVFGTPTITPTPVQGSTSPWLEHFNQPAGVQGGWFNVSNAQIRSTGLGYVNVTMTTGTNSWGYVTSATFTVNLDQNPMLRAAVRNVQASANGRISLYDTVTSTEKEITASLITGTTDYDIKALTGWSGSKSLYVKLTVEAASPGLGFTLDELWIYPASSNGFVEHFNAGSGGWYDVYNAHMDTTSNAAGKVSLVAGGANAWGYVTSYTMTLNLDVYNTLRVVVLNVDASSGNKIILVDSVSTTEKTIAQYFGTGTYEYDLRALTGWSGSKSFYFKLVVEGAVAGKSTTYDEFKIGPQGQ